jgi:hypothetical protein
MKQGPTRTASENDEWWGEGNYSSSSLISMMSSGSLSSSRAFRFVERLTGESSESLFSSRGLLFWGRLMGDLSLSLSFASLRAAGLLADAAAGRVVVVAAGLHFCLTLACLRAVGFRATGCLFSLSIDLSTTCQVESTLLQRALT